jgi:hypothetical protein
MPSLRHVQSALRTATETFAAELASPSGAAPQWDSFQWTMAKAVAVLHGVTPLLATTLRWRGPDDWQQFVSDQHRHTTARQQRILALLKRIDQNSREARVAFIALKGSALHAQGLYMCGQRPMADIDLLVPERDAPSMSEQLRSLGYRATFTTWKHIILEPREPSDIASAGAELPFGENEHAPIKIELHTHLSERLAVAAPDISQQVLSRTLEPGLNRYPSQIALMTHLLLHAAGNVVARNLRLIHLHDIALLGYRLGMDDWEQLLQLRVSGRPLWWALPTLCLVERYYRGCVPKRVIAQLGETCPRVLNRVSRRQRLSDVSYSRVANETFPGLTWASSLSEKFRCIRARINPDEEQRSMFEMIRAEPWVVSSGWSQLSRVQRVMRRVLTRPARLPTMYIVRAAIAASRQI